MSSMSAQLCGSRARGSKALTSIAECEAYIDQGLPIGQLVRVSVAWFLSRGTLSDNPETIETYRSFLVSGIVVARGLRTILDRTGAQRLFMLNGTFFAESIMCAIADERGIPFGTYEKGYIHDSIVLTPGAPAPGLRVPEELVARSAGYAIDSPRD